MSAPFGERRDHGWCPGAAVRLEDALDGGHADVREIDGPDQYRAGLERLERAERRPEGRDGAGFRLWILDDHAVVTGQNRLNPGRVGTEDHDARLNFERFQRLHDPDHER